MGSGRRPLALVGVRDDDEGKGEEEVAAAAVEEVEVTSGNNEMVSNRVGGMARPLAEPPPTPDPRELTTTASSRWIRKRDPDPRTGALSLT